MKFLSKLIVCAIALCMQLKTEAQFTWIFTTAAPSGTVANLTAGNVTRVNNNTANPTFLAAGAPASTGYTGASGGFNGNSSANIGALNTATSTYAQVVITPAANYWVNISGIKWGNYSVSSTGPTTLSIYTSIDNYATPVATVASGTNVTWNLLNPTFTPINGITGAAVTIRIYASGGTAGTPAAGTANWRMDDLVITATAQSGTAGNIPKYTSPSTFANSIMAEINNNIGVGTLTPAYKLDVAGNLRSTLDANINGLTVGRGPQNILGNTAVGISALSLASGGTNTAVGFAALQNNTTAYRNTAIGAYSLTNTTTGRYNTAVGFQSMMSNTTAERNTIVGYNGMPFSVSGGYNTGIGFGVLNNNISGANNTGIGYEPMFWITSGNNNVALGYHSGYDVTTGSQNIFLGYNAGYGVTTGNYNTIIGSDVTGLAPGLSNTIILADGQGNQRLLINASGNAGLGTSTPQNKLEITQGTAGNSGLRFTNLTSASAAASSSGKVLSVNATGDVILEVAGSGGGSGDGSETKVVSGSANVTVTGTGTIATPYSIAVSAPSSYWDNAPLGSGNIINNNAGGIIVGTGISTLPAGYKLYVSNGILAEKVKVALKSGVNWADHVFAKDYTLKPLSEVEAFIKLNQHLPGVPSAETLVKEGGVDVNQMFAKQMEKIEELTLYIIEMNKKLEKLEKENAALKSTSTIVNQ